MLSDGKKKQTMHVSYKFLNKTQAYNDFLIMVDNVD